MNTDYLIQDKIIREKRLRKKSKCRQCKNFNCDNVYEYTRDQNTIYDPNTNEILYGLNANMAVSGVSDGTTNQINPLIFTPHYKYGSGAAGGNPCRKDKYGIENFDLITNKYNHNTIYLIIACVAVVLCVTIVYKNK
jgi:hypothetical protein